MTLTDTVTSFAHDAVSTASDLGSQAVELGRTAADVGLDAASSVATAAGQLAQSLIHKVPVVPNRRRSWTPFVIAAVVAAIAAAALVVRQRRAGGADSTGKDSPAERIAVVADMGPARRVASAS